MIFKKIHNPTLVPTTLPPQLHTHGKTGEVWESLAGLRGLLHLLANSPTKQERVQGGRLLGDTVQSRRRAGGVFLAFEAAPQPICLDPAIRKDLCTSRQPADGPASSTELPVTGSALPFLLTLSHVVSTHSLGFSSPGTGQKGFPHVHL